MLILLFVYVICTILIGLGFSGRVDYPYSRFLAIFGMPIMIWILLGRLFRRVWFSYKLPEAD